MALGGAWPVSGTPVLPSWPPHPGVSPWGSGWGQQAWQGTRRAETQLGDRRAPPPPPPAAPLGPAPPGGTV